MVHFDTGVLQVEHRIQLRVHGRTQEGRVIKGKTGIIGKLGGIHTTQCSELRGIGKFQKTEDRISAQCLSLNG